MQYRKAAIAVVAVLATTLAAASPASAAWRGGGGHGGWHSGGHGGWHGGWRGGRGRGVGLDFATGAIIGGALAAPYYYGGFGYGPHAYDDDGYADGAYAAAPAYGGGDDQYCAQRYRSYDPGSGTFLGYDGLRHPCP